MPRTLADITSELQQQYPEIREYRNGETVALEPDAYEARLAEWAASVQAQERAQDQETVLKQRRQQAQGIYKKLLAGTATGREVQTALALTMRLLAIATEDDGA